MFGNNEETVTILGKEYPIYRDAEGKISECSVAFSEYLPDFFLLHKKSIFQQKNIMKKW